MNTWGSLNLYFIGFLMPYSPVGSFQSFYVCMCLSNKGCYIFENRVACSGKEHSLWREGSQVECTRSLVCRVTLEKALRVLRPLRTGGSPVVGYVARWPFQPSKDLWQVLTNRGIELSFPQRGVRWCQVISRELRKVWEKAGQYLPV